MINNKYQTSNLLDDSRFFEAIKLFNSEKWYQAHDAFEELWHETFGPERDVIQGVLQVAVAQLHLERGNTSGATILYGEGLGRLRKMGNPSLGFDVEKLCLCVEKRLNLLQQKRETDNCPLPVISIEVS